MTTNSGKPLTGTVADIDDVTLLARAVRSARGNYNKRVAHFRWVAVSHAFGLGSTYSCQLCERFGLDPYEEVKR